MATGWCSGALGAAWPCLIGSGARGRCGWASCGAMMRRRSWHAGSRACRSSWPSDRATSSTRILRCRTSPPGRRPLTRRGAHRSNFRNNRRYPRSLDLFWSRVDGSVAPRLLCSWAEGRAVRRLPPWHNSDGYSDASLPLLWAHRLSGSSFLRLRKVPTSPLALTALGTWPMHWPVSGLGSSPITPLSRAMGWLLVDGPVLEPQFRSFIGMYPIPYVHGMTIGELAQLYNNAFGIGADLRVVPMRGWRRHMNWADTGLPWVNPSPGLLTEDSPYYYATTGALDGTNLWKGVRTDARFQVILAPWIDGTKLAERLNEYQLPGVTFSTSPLPLPFPHKVSSGVRLHITEPSLYRPMATTVYVLAEIRKMYGNQLVFRQPRHGLSLFDQVWGTRQVRLGIVRGDDASAIVARWQPGLQEFLVLRQRYLLYPAVPQFGDQATPQ